MRPTATTVTERDRRLHATVCARPATGTWTDRCRCGQSRLRHRHAEHASIETAGVICSGRNHAGACRDCGCEGFEVAA